jgi:hypothetical protein
VTNTLHGLQWQNISVHPVKRAAVIIGASEAQVYALLKTGELQATRLAGKTLVLTNSLIAFLGTAKPWELDRDRVVNAVRARSEIKAKTPERLGRGTRAELADHSRRAEQPPDPALEPELT